METTTKQDKLLFFGITFAALAAFIFIINYVNPITGFGLIYIFLLAALMAGIITFLKYDFTKISSKYKSINPNLISGIIWSTLAIMKWVKYFNKDTFDWVIASLFTIVAIINWVGFFRKSDK
ncbi:hypothetical protein [Emticicia sp. W12TSBA100-4]|uniref:hypothetical protein n=1 Tax=Emticicia sp. W12TSBA100-4 TaxID=3160965 RepID=UPI0033066124